MEFKLIDIMKLTVEIVMNLLDVGNVCCFKEAGSASHLHL